MKELKPCPCGGSASAHAKPTTTIYGKAQWMYYVACDNCHKTTEIKYSPEESWDVWNGRADDD